MHAEGQRVVEVAVRAVAPQVLAQRRALDDLAGMTEEQHEDAEGLRAEANADPGTAQLAGRDVDLESAEAQTGGRNLRHQNRIIAAALGAALAGCGGSGPASAPAALSVGGTYTLSKAVLEDTCGGQIRTFVFTAHVQHTPGSATFVLNDSFNDLPGLVQPDGAFTIPALRTGTEQGAAIVGSFDGGRFTTAGFDVQARLDIDGPSGTPPFPACRVRESWRGVKQGPANVIP
jgi:hypothetical protein